MPYSAPWMTDRCRCSSPQPNAVCTMVCRSATVLSPETSSRRQISGLTACSAARNRYTPGDAAGSDTTSPVGTSSSGTAPSSPLAMLATVVRVGAGGQRDRRPRRGGPAPRARDGRSAPATASRHAGSGPAASVGWFPASASWVSAECRHFPRLRRWPPNGFAAAAEVRGITVRALLDQLSCQVEDAALMEQAARQMRQLREVDPEAWGNYLTEGGQWEEATIERLDA